MTDASIERSRRTSAKPTGVAFPIGDTASSFLLSLLRDAKESYPDAFDPIQLPSTPRAFKDTYPELILEFEQRRVASPARTAIARHLIRASRCRATLNEQPIATMDCSAPPLPITCASDRPGAGWIPTVDYDDMVYRGQELRPLVNDIHARGRMNDDTAATLHRALNRLDSTGALNLRGERFAVLGAAAELAPTRPLLKAGASVLWCDVAPPPPGLQGLLHVTEASADLLGQPDRIASTLADFAAAEGGPIHLGCFAYAPGQGREWRLALAMNAIASALGEGPLSSIGNFISPTTPVLLADDDVARIEEKSQADPGWRGAFSWARVLREKRTRAELPPVSDSIVAIQGVSYQAAQWLEKTLATEALRAESPGLNVSSNVAPISNTRSMGHALFQAAFRGAPSFDVEIFSPSVTRTLSTLLYIEDVLGSSPTAPGHFHGGALTVPYTADSAIRCSALIGFMRRS
ncbi:MAG: hypothetical protein AAF654_05960 [Myxococcota bacterium]